MMHDRELLHYFYHYYYNLFNTGVRTIMCVCAQSCLTLCNSMDHSPPGSSVHGILQARILEWVAISFSRDLPNPGTKSMSPALTDRFFTGKPSGKPKRSSVPMLIYSL